MADQISVVLAHGAWADGSSWSRVIQGLAKSGVKAVAAPLPLTSLSDDVSRLHETLDRVEGSVVLGGHAYAGGVIGSIRDPKVKALVYVAALAPDEGETVADVFYLNDPHPKAPKLSPDKQGLIWLPEEAFGSAFAQNASAEDQVLLAALQRPISPACISVQVPRPLWKDLPSWYLLAKQDRMIVEKTQLYMAQRMGAQIRSHDVDHVPSVSAPQIVTDLILEAIGRLAA